jgi:PhnB protein
MNHEEAPVDVKLNPYLSFRDNTRDAMEFYHTIFGGTLNMQTFQDLHASQDPSEDNLVMHSVLEGDNGIEFMASDTPSRMEFKPGSNFSMSISGNDEATLRGYFEKLADGGTITMPLEKAMWGDTFGMCNDKFGTSWLVNISPAAAG